MNHPKQAAIEKLTSLSFEDILPYQYFKRFADLYGGDLSDNPTLYTALYPEFEDLDAKFNTSRIAPIFLNDFDFCVDEERERLAQLIRMDFSSETFETVAKCQCHEGGLRGNYLIGSNIICDVCGSGVEKLTETEIETKVWIRLPAGVKRFINPAVFRTIFTKLTTKKPKFEIVTFIIDSEYRKTIGRDTESRRALEHHLLQLGIGRGINEFYENCDRIMEYFLVGPGRVLTSLSVAESIEVYDLYNAKRHLAFCSYLPVPNKLMTIVEKNGRDNYANRMQIELNQVYQNLADTVDVTQFCEVTQADIEKNIDIVGKSIVKLANKHPQNNHPAVFKKKGISRKHIAAGSLPLTTRSIITSRTGIMDTGKIVIPWQAAVIMLKEFIISHLYRKGIGPKKVRAIINRAYFEIIPEIDEFFRDAEARRDIVGMAGRTPSIEYLSRKTFFIEINRDLADLSIKIPITSVTEFNADFDGDQMYIYLLSDLESKAKAYGGFGHHQLLDENRLFKISRHCGQPSTNMINTNSVMHLNFKRMSTMSSEKQ